MTVLVGVIVLGAVWVGTTFVRHVRAWPAPDAWRSRFGEFSEEERENLIRRYCH